jgi:DNA invertase Pin-like site-specific DNA recombinase/DNA-binding CsgD family transcriptional regulator
MATRRGIGRAALDGEDHVPRVVHLTRRQVELLRLAARGLSEKQMANTLGISVRTVEDHFRRMRQRMGAHSQAELIAYGTAAGLVQPRTELVLESAVSGTAASTSAEENRSVRIGYARVRPCTRDKDDQAQLDALAGAHCTEMIVESASVFDSGPQLRRVLNMLRADDTLVVYMLDRVVRSTKELLVLLEDDLHTRGVNLDILCGIWAGFHSPAEIAAASRTLVMVAQLVTEMERDPVRERTRNELQAAQTRSCRRRGRPAAVNDQTLAIARSRRATGESVTAIARRLGIGRSTLYRALKLNHAPPDASGQG